MEFKSKAVLLFALVALALPTVACKKEGSAEKAGKEIDKAFHTAKEKIHEATK